MLNTDLLNFGKTVRTLRNKKNISQEQLADKCDLHKNYIGQVERGERNASLKNIIKIAQGLDIKVSKLFELFELTNEQI